MKIVNLDYWHEFFNSGEPVFDDELVQEILKVCTELSVFYFFCKLRNPSLTVDDFIRKLFGY